MNHTRPVNSGIQAKTSDLDPGFQIVGVVRAHELGQRVINSSNGIYYKQKLNL